MVLAPSVRKKEIERHIGEQGVTEKCFFVAWEGLLEKLSSNDQIFDPLGGLLTFELRSFVQEQIGFSDSVKRSLFELDTRWEPWGCECHRHLRDALWSIFPDDFRENHARGSGQSYCGWYFQSKTGWHWYGFVDSDRVDGDQKGDRRALFMLATNCTKMPKNDLSEHLKYVIAPGWTSNKYQCWILNFEPSWLSRDQWEKAIMQFINAVK